MKKEKLPMRRRCFTREIKINGKTICFNVGEYEDGRLGEIFVDVDDMGSSFSAMMHCFCILLSKALQYGMPLEEVIQTFIHTRFEPAGRVTGHEHIASCSSIVDFIFKELAIEYLGRDDLMQKGSHELAKDS